MEEFSLILSIPNNKEEKTNENTKEKKKRIPQDVCLEITNVESNSKIKMCSLDPKSFETSYLPYNSAR